MTDQPNYRLYAQFMRQMFIASHLFRSRMQQQLDQKGFTLAQFHILNHLAHQPSHIQAKLSDIASAVEVLQPAVTKAVNKLENLGLVNVRGDKNDKRIKLISINENGHQQLQQLQLIFTPDIEAWNQDWDDKDMQNFAEKLAKFGKWLDDNRL